MTEIKRNRKNRKIRKIRKIRDIRKNNTDKICTGLFRPLIDLLYPPRCPICRQLLDRGEVFVCQKCSERLPVIREPFCKKCGKPLEKQEQEYCSDCMKRFHVFDCGRAAFIYEKSFRDSVQRMKFHNHREYIPFYAAGMTVILAPAVRHWAPEVVIPVPMNDRKRRERGFDQSRLLAEQFAGRLGLPVDTVSLTRRRYTRAQKELTPQERRDNLTDAFSYCPVDVPETVLLVDDIYTTGATMDEISRVLRRAGVHLIYFAVLCTEREC